MKKILYLIILLLQLHLAAWAQQAFVVRRIQIQGLQRLPAETVENYLPIKRGQTLQPAKTGAVVRALYQTGFFDHISLSREGNTLVIHVVERPTIGQLKIKGNSIIPTDKLTTVMKTLDVAEGRVYNPVILERIRQSLLNQYYQLGRYNARVEVKATPMTRNRVLVVIDISEGLVAKVRGITIIGNHVFSERKLIKQLKIDTTGIFSFFTQEDRYAEERLEAGIENLRGFYMDRGYLQFEVKSSQAQVTPDRKSVYITIVISEGEPFTVEKYDIAGRLPVPSKEIEKRIQKHIKPGDTFSRKRVIDAEKEITKYLGDKGYLFATISIRPQVNEKTHQVVLIFDIKPGKRAYIRRITFSDNSRTNDVVLRREIEQMEGAAASTSKLETSKQRLSLLPYIKNVDMSVKPVSDSNNQVDIDYKVKEDNSAQASFRVGYSQLYRTTLGLGLNQKNFFGTGNTLGINFTRSKYQQYYAIDYTDPYYTEDGISRSFTFAISRVDPAGAGVNVGYTTHEYDLGVLYGIPIGQEPNVFSRLSLGASYQNVRLNLIPKYLSTQVNDFVTRHGTHYQYIDLKAGYSRNSLDKAIMPTSGMLQTLFLDFYAPASSNSASFYTLNYTGRWYKPLFDQFILLTKGNIGYGNGLNGAHNFPFFKNFYAGGMDSVRAFQGLTLGPRDSTGNPFGGNMLVNASLGLIFPNYISDNLRTSAFVDAGNVYSSLSNRSFGGLSTDSGPIRYSVGVEADWLTPVGPIRISLAQPLNARPHDQRESFQFALGTDF